MADEKAKNADFIGSVVKDAKNPVETRMLSGWFGDAGEEGFRRLYCDAELTSYVDIPDDAILYTEPIKDSQPAGAFLVWIKRDAAVQSGGSAASRAGRFLQGQVATDFGAAGSLDKAGLRCVTEVPCGEPTGFTGQCTKQPNVGGAWPCITAVPLCVEVTGFTGKCTHAPWPHPTRYIGCTILHCPTNDLTHIPHICNIVASGQPGCVVVNPPQGGEGVAAETEKLAETALPGCGYTKSWGLCETHLLGCGQANIPISAQACISPIPCSDFVACTQFCNQTKAPTALCTPAPKVCDTFCGPNCQTKQLQPICTSVNCATPAGTPCPELSMIPACYTGGSCQAAGAQPAQQAQLPQTLATVCTQFQPCHTYPRGDCTFFKCVQLSMIPACYTGGSCKAGGAAQQFAAGAQQAPAPAAAQQSPFPPCLTLPTCYFPWC